MKQIKAFNFKAGSKLSGKYEIIRRLGKGWESEVYLVEEIITKIPRAIKVFYPHRNKKNKVLNDYAKKLYQQKNCSLLIQYLSQEVLSVKGTDVHYMVSDYIDSETLDVWVRKQPKKYLTQFEALHVIYSLAKGLEAIHLNKGYHGDIHSSNILIRRKGLGFDLKIIDFHSQKGPKGDQLKHDITDLVGVLYEIVGGDKRYKKLKPELKKIILGRKTSLILKKFPKISDLRIYLETIKWDQ